MIMISLILRIVEVLLCLKKKPFKTRARNVNLNIKNTFGINLNNLMLS